MLNESFPRLSRRSREGMISAVSAGVFFILIGFIFVTTPGLFDRILAFFQNFDLVTVPNTGIPFPAPLYPSRHVVVYTAVEQFSFAWGLFQIVIFLLRFAVDSPIGKKAEAASNIVFWVGTGYLIRTFLIERVMLPILTATQRWFVFWSAIIMLLGVSLIVRAVILAAASAWRRT